MARFSQQDTIGNHALPVMRPVIVRQPMSTGHTAYHHLGHTAYHHLGDSTDDFWAAARVGAIGLATYHGYKKNGVSIMTAVWMIAAAITPIVTTAVVLWQMKHKQRAH